MRWLLGLGLVALLGFGLFLHLTGRVDVGGRQRAEATVETDRGDAAIASGADAANTVEAAGQRDAAIDAITRTNADAIRNAPGSNAAVDPRARDAGLRALCARAAYRDAPRCLQFADP